MVQIMKSDTLKIYIVLLANCHFRQGNSEIHIKYVDTKLPWTEAAKYCVNHGGVVESNDTRINHHLNITKEDVDVWVGQYKSWTPLFAVFGCYEVAYGTTIKVDRLGSHFLAFDCHKLCANADYFSIKNDQCVCIHDVSSLTRVKDYKTCNCCNCFQIWKRIDNIDIRDDGKNMSTDSLRCMVAQCLGNDYILTREKCTTSYAVLCDNGIRFVGLSQMNAAQRCANNGSFIKWIPESICSNKDNGDYQQQHWTSAIESVDVFKHVFQDNIDLINPIECYVRHKDRQQPFAYANCHQNLSFFCRTDTDAVEVHGQLTSFPPCKSYNENMARSGVNTGAVAGSVVAVLIIIIVILAGMFFYKRRKDNKIPNERNLQGNNKLSTQIYQTPSIRETSEHDYNELNINKSQDESQPEYFQIYE